MSRRALAPGPSASWSTFGLMSTGDPDELVRTRSNLAPQLPTRDYALNEGRTVGGDLGLRDAPFGPIARDYRRPGEPTPVPAPTTAASSGGCTDCG